MRERLCVSVSVRVGHARHLAGCAGGGGALRASAGAGAAQGDGLLRSRPAPTRDRGGGAHTHARAGRMRWTHVLGVDPQQPCRNTVAPALQ
eukprot:1639961-Pleurochrysis_carterae.AAC.1